MITYVQGDAARPDVSAPGEHIIAHVVNDQGGWGRGFTRSLSQRYPRAERSYREWVHKPTFSLGRTLITRISREPSLMVAHLLAQHGYMGLLNPQPLSYDALVDALEGLERYCLLQQAPLTIHMPRIGCGLAGGEWSHVEVIVSGILLDVPVIVYDLPV